VADEIGPGWLPAMCLMAEVEIHLAGNDLLRAEQCARDMVATASHFGHERMAADGHLMVARILERRGLVAEALREMHRLQQRQQRALADRTESRQFVVGWRLALRDEQQRVRRLERSSRRLAARHRQLERLTMEDALTGALNRRGIEQEGEALVGSGAVLTVAMIDVDDFKRVNDTCSHAAGDAVLRMLAQAMQVQTRAGDVVGRLAGDEFVILFPSTHLAEATTVCERLSAAIARCAWDTVAPGAAVSVSIGLAEHEPGESLASTLARSDAQMYAAKRRRKTRRVRERTAAAPARDGASAATERASG
jgi:diguanylate cyclase (GGDEF)-like protein